MDPNPEAFEKWRLGLSMDAVRIWLEHGVPSDDSEDDKPREPHSR